MIRTFHPDGSVDFDVKIYENQKLVEHFQRQGKLNRSVFLETTSSTNNKI